MSDAETTPSGAADEPTSAEAPRPATEAETRTDATAATDPTSAKESDAPASKADGLNERIRAQRDKAKSKPKPEPKPKPKKKPRVVSKPKAGSLALQQTERSARGATGALLIVALLSTVPAAFLAVAVVMAGGVGRITPAELLVFAVIGLPPLAFWPLYIWGRTTVPERVWIPCVIGLVLFTPPFLLQTVVGLLVNPMGFVFCAGTVIGVAIVATLAGGVRSSLRYRALEQTVDRGEIPDADIFD